MIGVLVDMDRGIIGFYKDGVHLGSGAVQTSLKYGAFFPFLQTNENGVEMSIFHPFVYPAYRAPVPPEEVVEQ